MKKDHVSNIEDILGRNSVVGEGGEHDNGDSRQFTINLFQLQQFVSGIETGGGGEHIRPVGGRDTKGEQQVDKL